MSNRNPPRRGLPPGVTLREYYRHQYVNVVECAHAFAHLIPEHTARGRDIQAKLKKAAKRSTFLRKGVARNRQMPSLPTVSFLKGEDDGQS